MKTSFANAGSEPVNTETEKTVAPVQSKEIAVNESTAVVPDSYFSNEGMEGDFDRSDIQLPKLNLVQSVGPLSEFFSPGQMVYAKELVLPVPVEFTLLKMRKYFVEDIPFGSEQFPKIVNTVEEVRKDGGLLSSEKREFGEGHTYFKPVLDADVLIKGTPDNVVFPFEFNGTPYGIARWTLQSVAYGRTAKQFITATQLGLRNGLTLASWTVTPKREKVGMNFIWLPIARQAAKNSPEFIAWIKDITQS